MNERQEALTGLANLINGIDGGEHESMRQLAAFNFIETIRMCGRVSDDRERALQARVAELEAKLVQHPSAGVKAIATERFRQMDKLGWTPEEDDRWTSGQLTSAAIAYLFCNPIGREGAYDDPKKYWPWGYTFKPETQLRNLEKAGALIAAEIDRRTRLEENSSTSS